MAYGYLIDCGYVGYVDGRRMLFATEHEYYEYLKERESNDA